MSETDKLRKKLERLEAKRERLINRYIIPVEIEIEKVIEEIEKRGEKLY